MTPVEVAKAIATAAEAAVPVAKTTSAKTAAMECGPTATESATAESAAVKTATAMAAKSHLGGVSVSRNLRHRHGERACH
jgi:hypothetical protein